MDAFLSWIFIKDWTIIFSFIFGGCCSNAWALEVVTKQYPHAGSFITFSQFLVVSVVGLPKQLCITLPGQSHNSGGSIPAICAPLTVSALLHKPSNVFNIRLKPRSIPLSRWMIQVSLFFLTSLLNNAAFGFKIPMAVHIIFRSAGLVTNLILGKLLASKKYTRTQVVSVLIITTGVALTTTAKGSRKEASYVSSTFEQTLPVKSGQYATGIAILTLALVLSSAMGLAQDAAYTEYGRGHWEEGMFYLHFLSMPMFAFLKDDMAVQVAEIRKGESMCLRDLIYNTLAIPLPTVTLSKPLNTILDIISTVTIPTFYFPLLLNIITQLLCVSGVHRLTSQVSSLTVTLALTVRKAVSLIISVVILGGGKGDLWLWLGAGLVLVGTVLYTLGSMKPTPSRDTTSSKKTL